MDYIRSLFKFRERKSPPKCKPEKKAEKLSDKSESFAGSEPANKEKQLKDKTSRTSFNSFLRGLFRFPERKSAQKHKREEKDEKLRDGSNSNPESEPVCKKKRLNEETNGFSFDTIQCRICLDVVSCSVMRSLPCAHVFHENCLFQWLEISKVCPLCKWPTTDNTDDALFIGLYELIETIGNNDDVTGGNEYDAERYETASDGSDSDYPPNGSSSESEPDGSNGISPSDELSGNSSPQGFSGISSPNGSSGESQPERSKSKSIPDGSSSKSEPERSSGKSLPNESSSESPPGGSSSESPLVGSSDEPPSKGESTSDITIGESLLNRSSSETSQDGLSDNAQ